MTASPSLRQLLSQPGSYPIIAAAVASRGLPRFPVTLFEHVGTVYERVETAADRNAKLDALRLAALVHEEPPDALAELLGSAELADFLPTVLGVIGAFGRIWKARTNDELHDYVRIHATGLTPLLVFELAHEGRPTLEMARAAEIGGLRPAFERWAGRRARST